MRPETKALVLAEGILPCAGCKKAKGCERMGFYSLNYDVYICDERIPKHPPSQLLLPHLDRLIKGEMPAQWSV